MHGRVYYKMTQKDKVLKRLQKRGYVDNFWAIKNYILRLGAIIHTLKNEGHTITRKYGTGKNRYNSFYYLEK
jgi:hypothetical protein